MNPALADYYAREKKAMGLYDATTQAALGNAQPGGNPLAPNLTAMEGGGILPLAPVMSAGPGTMPWSGESSKLMSGTFMPFGGFRAKGGPVMPGMAYMVGERGPEMIVPQMPGMVLPNPATSTGGRIAQSPMNRPYAELPGGSSLANRPTRDIGRSANDPARATAAAARFLRSKGDPVGAARMVQNGALLDARVNGLPELPAAGAASPVPMGAIPTPGRWVAGRSAGSQVWQPDAPPVIDVPAEPSPMTRPSASVPMGASPVMAPAEEVMNPFQLDPLGNPVNPQAFMVPSGFNNMNERLASAPAGFPGLPLPPPGLYGAEAPPMVSSLPIPGTDQMMPMIGGLPKGTPVAKTPPRAAAEWQPPKMYDEVLPEVKDPTDPTKILKPATTRQYYFVQDPKTGRPMKEYALDANGDGVPDNQQPGWMDWLNNQK